uniref:(northern house mosquito) hypothetical protein n=1 Tax=Culex pipiens TaxID=7175 RepID=A0A8D8GRD5_CULPI
MLCCVSGTKNYSSFACSTLTDFCVDFFLPGCNFTKSVTKVCKYGYKTVTVSDFCLTRRNQPNETFTNASQFSLQFHLDFPFSLFLSAAFGLIKSIITYCVKGFFVM